MFDDLSNTLRISRDSGGAANHEHLCSTIVEHRDRVEETEEAEPIKMKD